MIAKALVTQVRGTQEVIQTVDFTAGLDVIFLLVEFAHRQPRFGVGIGRTRFRVQADHTAGGTAVQRRRRAADDLDPFDRTEFDIIDDTLAIRHRGRDAVDEHADPADAEIGPRTETAQRDPQILGKVVAILRKHARHPVQRLVERELLAPELDILLVDDADRAGDVRERLPHTAGPDFDDLGFGRGRAHGRDPKRGGEDRGRERGDFSSVHQHQPRVFTSAVFTAGRQRVQSEGRCQSRISLLR